MRRVDPRDPFSRAMDEQAARGYSAASRREPYRLPGFWRRLFLRLFRR